MGKSRYEGVIYTKDIYGNTPYRFTDVKEYNDLDFATAQTALCVAIPTPTSNTTK